MSNAACCSGGSWALIDSGFPCLIARVAAIEIRVSDPGVVPGVAVDASADPVPGSAYGCGCANGDSTALLFSFVVRVADQPGCQLQIVGPEALLPAGVAVDAAPRRQVRDRIDVGGQVADQPTVTVGDMAMLPPQGLADTEAGVRRRVAAAILGLAAGGVGIGVAGACVFGLVVG